MLFNQAPLLTKQNRPDDRSICVDFIWVNEFTCSINCPIFTIVREVKAQYLLKYICQISLHFALQLSKLIFYFYYFFNNEKEKKQILDRRFLLFNKKILNI